MQCRLMGRKIQGIVGGIVVVLMTDGMVHADTLTYQAKHSSEVQLMKIPTGKSAVIDVPVPIKRASLANPDIADAIVLTPKQIYVTGKGYGMTNLTLWGKDEQILAIFDVEVGLDVTRLKARLSSLLPDEDGIQVTATNDHVTLTGTVSSTNRMSQATALAEAFAPKKVINFLKVHPEMKEEVPPSVVVEVIKGTSVNHVTPK
ncbi:MAG TPA: pilus assembly protein N-terminal domain-containing protein [Nitrospira sp.]|nr:pilus assembly protein N-terminal domain-containing protein [Nitrospira sp.]